MKHTLTARRASGRVGHRAAARGVLLVLLLAAGSLAAGCEWWAVRQDDRSKDGIKEAHGDDYHQLAAKQAERERLQARLVEEGWTHNEAGELAPPRGLDRGDQVKEAEEQLHHLDNEIAEIQARINFNERVWVHRGYDVAELTRDAAIRVQTPPVD